MKKKGFAKFLMIEAILIFILGFIGTCIVSNQEVVEYIEPLYWNDEETYETKNQFNPSTFFSGLFETVVFASLVLAASEILDKAEKNNEMLRNLSGEEPKSSIYKQVEKESSTYENNDTRTTMYEDFKNKRNLKRNDEG